MATETAYAKINLALHVRRRRDGRLSRARDAVRLRRCRRPADGSTGAPDELQVVGEFADQLTDPFGNIVARALSALPRPAGWRSRSRRACRSPPGSAGVGRCRGGVPAGRAAHGLPDDWRERAARLGADVPACVESVACIGRGHGTELEPVENDLAGTAVLLVNPRVPLATGPVFAAWDGVDRGKLPEGTAWDIARAGSQRSRGAGDRAVPADRRSARRAARDRGRPGPHERLGRHLLRPLPTP
jgi:4-diphosphocytidyl-2-C-methyl-D-erythritol kinase